jgi:hypothetical protein
MLTFLLQGPVADIDELITSEVRPPVVSLEMV